MRLSRSESGTFVCRVLVISCPVLVKVSVNVSLNSYGALWAFVCV